MSYPIKKIQKGDPPYTLTWTVGNKYIRICEELKYVRYGEGHSYQAIVFRCYDQDNIIAVEIESCNNLVITYANPQPVHENVNVHES